jgi:hypothetical protein
LKSAIISNSALLVAKKELFLQKIMIHGDKRLCETVDVLAYRTYKTQHEILHFHVPSRRGVVMADAPGRRLEPPL